jgi:hypothetical protein
MATAAALLCLPAAALADAVVVRSTGPSSASYPVGTRIAPAQRITLRQGDRIVLVGEGPTRTISGPGTFQGRSAGTPRQNGLDTLRRFMDGTNARISQTGATRGANASIAPPNLWVVDMGTLGVRCVNTQTPIIAWRAATAADSAFTLVNTDDQAETTTLTFNAGQSLLRWPVDRLPVDARTTYAVTAARAAAGELTLVPVGPFAADAPLETVVAALAQQGCSAQLQQLSDQIGDE